MHLQYPGPPIAKEPLSLVLPAFNQIQGLEAIVAGWVGTIEKLRRPVELILIDDGSTDGTGPLADQLAERHPIIKVLHHDAHRGPGAALRTGLAAATHPLVGTLACDYPYAPADLRKLLDAIDTADLVAGRRTGTPLPAGLHSLGAMYRILMRILVGVPIEPSPGWLGWSEYRRWLFLRWGFGLRLHDPNCALQLFRRSLVERIPVQSDGPFAHAEILAKANFLGCMMAEVPVGKLAGNFRGVADPSSLGQGWWRDARQVFAHPTF